MQRGSAQECALVRHAIENREVQALQSIADIVRQTGAKQATRDAASAQAQLALTALTHLPDTPHKQAMAELAEQLLSRQA
jgi:octaprenyl-diphosphate synthase